jgi:hypothetical protein
MRIYASFRLKEVKENFLPRSGIHLIFDLNLSFHK